MVRNREFISDTIAVETPRERYKVSTDGSDREYDKQKGYPPECPECGSRLDTPILTETGDRVQEFCAKCEKIRHIIIRKTPRIVYIK